MQKAKVTAKGNNEVATIKIALSSNVYVELRVSKENKAQGKISVTCAGQVEHARLDYADVETALDGIGAGQ